MGKIVRVTTGSILSLSSDIKKRLYSAIHFLLCGDGPHCGT